MSLNRGMYSAVYVLQPTLDRLNRFIKEMGLPRTQEDLFYQLHATLFTSKTAAPAMRPDYELVHEAKFESYNVYRSDGKNRLVMMLNAPSLHERNQFIARTHGITHVFPEYEPHITIAYDVGFVDWWKLPPFEPTIWLGDENVRAAQDRKPIRKITRWNQIKNNLLEKDTKQ